MKDRHRIAPRGAPRPPLAALAVRMLAVVVLALPAPSRADVYVLVEADGTTRFSSQPDDPRYQLFLKEPTEYRLKSLGELASLRNPGDYRLRAPAARRPDVHANPLLEGKPFNAQVSKAARTHEVDPALVHAVIAAESNYNAKVVSHKGAIGLMQVMPDTGRRYGVKEKDLYAPAKNIAIGVRYLAELIVMFEGDLELALAGYNAGENTVLRFGRKMPPYPETRAYVPRVLRYYDALRVGDG